MIFSLTFIPFLPRDCSINVLSILEGSGPFVSKLSIGILEGSDPFVSKLQRDPM